MHYEEIKDEYFNNILRHIRHYLPDFVSIWEDEDVIYPIAFELGNYLIENFNDKSILLKGALFVNEALEQGSSEVEDLVVLQIFHLFYENKSRYKDFENFLNPQSKEVYEKFYKLWLNDFRPRK